MDFKKILKRKKYLATIPLNLNFKVIGFDNFNIDTFMGYSLEGLKWPVLLSLIFSVLSFGLAGFFIVRYTRDFYAKRAIPSSWKFILWGILMTAAAETTEILVFYKWPEINFIEFNLFLVPQAIGGILIGYGSYLLYKKIKV